MQVKSRMGFPITKTVINIGYNLQGLKDVIVFPKIKYQQQRKRTKKLECYLVLYHHTILLFVSISVHNYVIVKLVPEFTCFSVEQNQQKRWVVVAAVKIQDGEGI